MVNGGNFPHSIRRLATPRMLGFTGHARSSASSQHVFRRAARRRALRVWSKLSWICYFLGALCCDVITRGIVTRRRQFRGRSHADASAIAAARSLGRFVGKVGPTLLIPGIGAESALGQVAERAAAYYWRTAADHRACGRESSPWCYSWCGDGRCSLRWCSARRDDAAQYRWCWSPRSVRGSCCISAAPYARPSFQHRAAIRLLV
jgi:hypothetical protein